MVEVLGMSCHDVSGTNRIGSGMVICRRLHVGNGRADRQREVRGR